MFLYYLPLFLYFLDRYKYKNENVGSSIEKNNMTFVKFIDLYDCISLPSYDLFTLKWSFDNTST